MREAAQGQEQLSLIVFLTQQPAYEISRQEKDAQSQVRQGIAMQLEQLMLPFGLDDVLPQPVRLQVRGLNQQREGILEKMRASIYSRTKALVQGQQDRFQQFVEEELNGKIRNRIVLVNAFGIEIPANMLNALAQHLNVDSIYVNHQSVKPLLNNSTQAVGAHYWWNQGYEGPDGYNVAVLDTGITFDPAYPFKANGLLSHKGAAGDNKSWWGTNISDTSNGSGHGTPVAGIIASKGTTLSPNTKGVAYEIGDIINGRVLIDGNAAGAEADIMEAIEWAIFQSTSRAECINLSLKVENIRSPYHYEKGALTKTVDFYVDTAGVPIVIAAGNRGTLGMTKPADAYNAIAVGNVRDNNTASTTDDELVSKSSRDRHGHRMLDLVAPGASITSSAKNDQSNGFARAGSTNDGGTSFAAPHVTGAVALVSSVLSDEPHTIKALLLNTATDQFNPANSDDTQGWDKHHGYGYLNLYRAYYFRYVYPRSISQGQTLYFTGVISPGAGDLGKLTIVWHTHLSSPTDNEPDLSNLDLRLYDYTNNQQGALLESSTSSDNNVEQVIYTGPVNRRVLVKIDGVSITGTSEDFTLASMHSLTTIASPAPAAASSTSAKEVITNELGNNFPNPFNPDTWIPYAIAEEASVKIQIYDTQGRLVRVLDLGQKPAGRYLTKDKAAYWDGRNDTGERVTSGAYFYYLEGGDFRATRKLVIRK